MSAAVGTHLKWVVRPLQTGRLVHALDLPDCRPCPRRCTSVSRRLHGRLPISKSVDHQAFMSGLAARLGDKKVG